MNSLVIIIGAGLAVIIGFAAHRANLCSVRAVKEILTSRRAFMLAGFVKAAFWVMGITMLGALLLPLPNIIGETWAFSLTCLVGGAIFGVGATLNGGCAFSTLTRLGAGDAGMLVSLVGFFTGASLFGVATSNELLLTAVTAPSLLAENTAWQIPVVIVVTIWMIWELFRLAKSSSSFGLKQRILEPTYRVSSAAMLMGICNALLYVMVGVWPYTRLFNRAADSSVDAGSAPPTILWILFLGLLAGVALSALSGGRFKARWRPQKAWLIYAFGGVLMGLGAAMIPGGNDVMILHSIPSFSPHAVPAFVTMFVGIALALLTMQFAGQAIPKVDCGGDLCRDDGED